MSTIIVTGAAGFIGYHVAEHLIARGDRVVGVDSMNAYYDPALKEARLARLCRHATFEFERTDLAQREDAFALFARVRPSRVVHLAAQAGVRYSLENPLAYVEANLTAFVNVLEGCRHNEVEHLVYASSSSVYGANTRLPFSVHHNVDHPVSLYAATKKANELLAHSYSHLFGMPVTGLRFFTVYGPWGRPDMALFKFTRAILAGDPIDVYNHGQLERDFTFVDDVVEGVVRTLDRTATPDPAWRGDAPDPGTSYAPFRVYNIGNHSPVGVLELIATIEEATGHRAELRMMPMQPGDVPATFADVEDLARDVGFRPATPLADGVRRFVAWYRDYFGIPA